eukprot:scaffold19747_cov19-Tisochrysis_lutea.AAC.1
MRPAPWTCLVGARMPLVCVSCLGWPSGPDWTQHLLALALAEKYEDIAGTAFPQQTKEYLDTWKRPEELVQGFPNIPVVIFKQTPPSSEPKEKGVLLSRLLPRHLLASISACTPCLRVRSKKQVQHV